MQALIVIDAQNEFSNEGQRPVSDFLQTIGAIKKHVEKARTTNTSIAWVRHFNQRHESPAFVPDSWGADFFEGLGPAPFSHLEKEFRKNVYGAFTGSDIGDWLQSQHIDTVLITGFYTHGCVSTTAREAIMRSMNVVIDSNATATCDLQNEKLGALTANEVKRSALIQLAGMGAIIL